MKSVVFTKMCIRDSGKTVRAINVHAKLSKGQHEKLLKFAQSIGMGGLGYLEVKDVYKRQVGGRLFLQTL